MKILFFTDQYYPISGGIEQYVRGLSSSLSKLGHDIVILTRSIAQEQTQENDGLLRIIRTDLMLNAIPNPELMLSRWAAILPLVRREAPDIIYANHHTSIAAIKIGKNLGIPTVYCCHGWGLLCPNRFRFVIADGKDTLCLNNRNIKSCLSCAGLPLKINHRRAALKNFRKRSFLGKIHGIFNLISPIPLARILKKYDPEGELQLQNLKVRVRRYDYYQKLLNSADRIVSLSNKYSSFFAKKRTVTIPLGIDTDIYRPLPTKKTLEKYGVEADYILVPSRIHHNKGQYVTVESLRYLPDRIKLVLAGNSRGSLGEKHEINPHMQELNDSIERYGLEDRLVFTGFLNLEEMIALYSGALATLVPSVWLDPFPYVTLEAMSCACPVIASAECGSAEMIRDGVDGFIVPRQNPSVMAEAVLKVADNREKMGQLARTNIKKLCDWRVISPRIESLFRQISDNG